jgi:hypothetical protein
MHWGGGLLWTFKLSEVDKWMRAGNAIDKDAESEANCIDGRHHLSALSVRMEDQVAHFRAYRQPLIATGVAGKRDVLEEAEA